VSGSLRSDCQLGVELVRLLRAAAAPVSGRPVVVDSGINGDAAAAGAFWQEWEAEEVPFLDDDRPWERALLIVRGTAPVAHDPTRVVLAAPEIDR